MPKVGNNNEPLLERALFGFDGSLWKPLTLDSNGYLEVTLPLANTITARAYGKISSSWQAQPLLKGYSDTVTEQVIIASASAGGNSIVGTSVPTGEIWTIEAIQAVDINNAPTQVDITAYVSTVSLTLFVDKTPGANASSLWNGLITLKTGDSIQAIIAGVTTGDTLVMNYHGYKTDIDLT